MRTRTLAVALSAVAVLVLAGCNTDKYSEQYRDAPRANEINDDAAATITFPDGFSNAATKCDHGNRVYVLFHEDSAYGSIAVVPADASCVVKP